MADATPYPDNTGWKILDPDVEQPSQDGDQYTGIITFQHADDRRELQFSYEFALGGEVLKGQSLERAKGTLDGHATSVDETYDALMEEDPCRQDLRRNYCLYDTSVSIEPILDGHGIESLLEREESQLLVIELEQHCAFRDLTLAMVSERLTPILESLARQIHTFDSLDALWAKAIGTEDAEEPDPEGGEQ